MPKSIKLVDSDATFMEGCYSPTLLSAPWSSRSDRSLAFSEQTVDAIPFGLSISGSLIVFDWDAWLLPSICSSHPSLDCAAVEAMRLQSIAMLLTEARGLAEVVFVTLAYSEASFFASAAKYVPELALGDLLALLRIFIRHGFTKGGHMWDR